jgi:hypothetical protein
MGLNESVVNSHWLQQKTISANHGELSFKKFLSSFAYLISANYFKHCEPHDISAHLQPIKIKWMCLKTCPNIMHTYFLQILPKPDCTSYSCRFDSIISIEASIKNVIIYWNMQPFVWKVFGGKKVHFIAKQMLYILFLKKFVKGHTFKV